MCARTISASSSGSWSRSSQSQAKIVLLLNNQTAVGRYIRNVPA